MGNRADGDGCTGPDGYVMHSGYQLDADHGCIALARHRAAAFLDQAAAKHGLSVSARTRDLTQLVVSELVTNARKYAPGPAWMELRVNARAVDVVVADSHTAVPTARAADPARIGQHGLEIVEAVTESLLIEKGPAGKRITARLVLSDRPPPGLNRADQ
ncbi:ATP-binding protein [Streptomyces sp. NPDC127168]|uniref:ATP-binding protein n=1 Tax=unclassified Streptomyces TaxID=2593676 RepID=UPI003637C1E9